MDKDINFTPERIRFKSCTGIPLTRKSRAICQVENQDLATGGSTGAGSFGAEALTKMGNGIHLVVVI
ncbi:unnamed protein product [Nezara viridula]|uniref:Uncharacterized protein n=1 Tax=Nezara viridula TaxID=85310 RepID=A0A9P0HC16_NEZVI|nr:unnamed protein product [Nezara viridula]